MLTEQEKEDLVLEHQGIVYSMANRYRYFDEIEDVRGWGYIGLVRAINRYEEKPNLSFPTIAFPMVKTEILAGYRRKNLDSKEVSMDQQESSEEGEGKTIGDYLSDDNQLNFTFKDILRMFEESLIDVDEIKRNIITDYYLLDKDVNEIAKEYDIPKGSIKKIHRRGQALIKRYLVNKAVLSEYAINPNRNIIKKEKVANFRKLDLEDYGKMKYLFRYFDDLTINDIAIILRTSSYMIIQLLNYRTTDYFNAPYNDSIKEKAFNYYKENYPERIPSEVKVYEMV